VFVGFSPCLKILLCCIPEHLGLEAEQLLLFFLASLDLDELRKRNDGVKVRIVVMIGALVVLESSSLFSIACKKLYEIIWDKI
jgi:hypothetical protein